MRVAVLQNLSGSSETITANHCRITILLLHTLTPKATLFIILLRTFKAGKQICFTSNKSVAKIHSLLGFHKAARCSKSSFLSTRGSTLSTRSITINGWTLIRTLSKVLKESTIALLTKVLIQLFQVNNTSLIWRCGLNRCLSFVEIEVVVLWVRIGYWWINNRFSPNTQENISNMDSTIFQFIENFAITF